MASLTIRVVVVSDGAGQTEITKSIRAQGPSLDMLRDSRGQIVEATSGLAREVIDLALTDYQELPLPQEAIEDGEQT